MKKKLVLIAFLGSLISVASWADEDLDMTSAPIDMETEQTTNPPVPMSETPFFWGGHPSSGGGHSGGGHPGWGGGHSGGGHPGWGGGHSGGGHPGWGGGHSGGGHPGWGGGHSGGGHPGWGGGHSGGGHPGWGGGHHGGWGGSHPGHGYGRAFYPVPLRGSYRPWRHWGHPYFGRPTYGFEWARLRSITCTAEDYDGNLYPVVEDEYFGHSYESRMEQIEDDALDRCFHETGGDESCSLVGCEASY